MSNGACELLLVGRVVCSVGWVALFARPPREYDKPRYDEERFMVGRRLPV